MGMGQVIDINQFILDTEKASPNGVATLDSNAKVPKNQIDLIASDVGAQPLGDELTALQSLVDTPGFLRKTGSGSYSINTEVLVSSSTGISGASTIVNVVSISRANYNSLTPSATVLYLIQE